MFWISRLSVPELGPLLIGELASMQPYVDEPKNTQEAAYIAAVFDALILSGTIVPERDLSPFEQSWRDEVLIVQSRQQGGEEFLLSMRGAELSKAQWTAVNNLLLRMRSDKFFRKALSELPLTHTFVIVDEVRGGFGGLSGGGFGGGGVGCGVRGLPRGFPPIGLYQLKNWPSEGDVLLVKGPRDIYYHRTLIPTDVQAGWSVVLVPFGEQDKRKDGLEYLAFWNNVKPDTITGIFWATTTVRWHDMVSFQDSTESALAGQIERIQDFLDSAKQRGAGDLSGLQLGIAVNIVDERQGGEPIPANLPSRLFTVR